MNCSIVRSNGKPLAIGAIAGSLLLAGVLIGSGTKPTIPGSLDELKSGAMERSSGSVDIQAYRTSRDGTRTLTFQAVAPAGFHDGTYTFQAQDEVNVSAIILSPSSYLIDDERKVMVVLSESDGTVIAVLKGIGFGMNSVTFPTPIRLREGDTCAFLFGDGGLGLLHLTLIGRELSAVREGFEVN